MDSLIHLSRLDRRRILQASRKCVILKKPLTKLVEVGKLEDPKNDDYTTGQLILNRSFGYRGVVLFPWKAILFEHDNDDEKTLEEIVSHDNINFKFTTYYQVLFDSRDCPYIRGHMDAVTYLGQKGDQNYVSLNTIQGLDCVPHEDIVPYLSTEKTPVHHSLFEKLFRFVPRGCPSFRPSATLKAWKRRVYPWFELSDVHRETTENVRITAIPFYLGSRSDRKGNVNYWWRYCIRMENLGDKTVHLRERQLSIFSLSGDLETIKGEGVAGQEPSLSKSNPVFQFSSHVSLAMPHGLLWGSFIMERDDGHQFECRIPSVMLRSKEIDTSPNPPSVSFN